MPRGRKPLNDLNIASGSEYYAGTFKGKFLDDLAYKSQFRCAESIMESKGANSWYPLMKKGYAVVAVDVTG